MSAVLCRPTLGWGKHGLSSTQGREFRPSDLIGVRFISGSRRALLRFPYIHLRSEMGRCEAHAAVYSNGVRVLQNQRKTISVSEQVIAKITSQ